METYFTHLLIFYVFQVMICNLICFTHCSRGLFQARSNGDLDQRLPPAEFERYANIQLQRVVCPVKSELFPDKARNM